MEIKMQATSDSAELKKCNSDDNIIETGQMSECVSVIMLCTDGTFYGIHCGGGITGGWPDKITDLFQQEKKSCKKMVVVFGANYLSPNEKQFIGSKIEAVKNIQKDVCASELSILCSGNLILEKTESDIKYKSKNGYYHFLKQDSHDWEKNDCEKQ